jgi:hypothetical protein
MLTLDELTRHTDAFYNTNGFKGVVELSPQILEQCLTEKSFIDSYCALTLSDEIEKLTIGQLLEVLNARGINLKMYELHYSSDYFNKLMNRMKIT